MKTLKISGLLFFLIGFFIFDASFFWADFKLTPEVVQQSISDKAKRALFISNASILLNEPIGSNFQFVNRLEDIFERINQQQIEKFNITPEDLNALITANDNGFSIANVDSTFRTSNETAAFKNKAFKQYAGSLEGKKFST